MPQRTDGRAVDQLRPTKITPGVLSFAEGSALIEVGLTRVLCAATVEERVPAFLKGQGKGWVTAEYAMLPRSTLTRTQREVQQGHPSGRSQEIQRLIGRSMRAALDLKKLGERTVTLDCDVLQADGGTRTAAITGAYVALYQALYGLAKRRILPAVPLRCAVAAVSVGVVDKGLLLDLKYDEDARAEVDFNVVMTDKGEYVEVQGTGEGGSFSPPVLQGILALASRGIDELLESQRQVIAGLQRP